MVKGILLGLGKPHSMKILALDISGTATGWAFGYDGRLEGYGKYIVTAKDIKGKKLYDFSVFIKDLILDKQPDIILIEKPYLGRNSKVLVNISKFIAVVQIVAYDVLKMDLPDDWFLDPKRIKRLVKVKKGNSHEENKKNMVVRVNNLYGLRLKYKKGKNKQYCDDDISDAIAVLTAWWRLEGANE